MFNLHKTFINVCVLCISAICSCPAFSQTSTLDRQGHRGARGLMPENTIPAMLEAIRQGVTTIEMDVVVTVDRKVVVSHDPFMNALFCTDPGGKSITEQDQKKYLIFGMNYDEVRKWDVGLKLHPQFPSQKKMPAHKPLLSDLIDSVEQYTKLKKLKPVLYNIETKSSPLGDGISNPVPEEFVSLLTAIIEQKKIAHRVIIQSFDKRTLQVLHQTHPAVQTAYLVPFSNKKMPYELIEELGFRPTIISPEFRLVDPGYVKSCHEANMKLVVWTVNDTATIKKMVGLGVDGIISDYPNLFNTLK